jgi:ATP-dependent DNA ligase
VAGVARAAGLAYAAGVPSREEFPRFVAPMLARTGPVPIGGGWAVEVKFDGMRLQLRRDGRAVCLRSRSGRDCTEEFPELASIRRALGRQLASVHRAIYQQLALVPASDRRQ